MPRKTKEVEKSFALKHWRPITAVASVLLVISGISVFANEQFVQGQISVSAAAESALELGEKQSKEVSSQLDELEQAIREAEQTAADSNGRILEEKDRESLLVEIETGKEVWVEKKTKLLELEAALKVLKGLREPSGQWDSDAITIAKAVTELAGLDWDPILAQKKRITDYDSAVQLAQELWQKEQDRIAAAEAAARMAKAKTVETVSTITEDGASAVTAPPPPPVNAEPLVGPTTEAFLSSFQQATAEGVSTRQFIENYILSLAPGSVFNWMTGLCDGFYVCGRALVGGANTNPVEIQLDPGIEDVYVDRFGVGRYVLVHEAAHARQWLRFGAPGQEGLDAFVRSQEQFTAARGVTGTLAVEIMADCMTISYLGYSVRGSYTESCSPEELVAANSMW